MELGCFLAGALISSQGHMVTEEIMSYIEPIRDFLVIIFFASIGNLPCLRQDVCGDFCSLFMYRFLFMQRCAAIKIGMCREILLKRGKVCPQGR